MQKSIVVELSSSPLYEWKRRRQAGGAQPALSSYGLEQTSAWEFWPSAMGFQDFTWKERGGFHNKSLFPAHFPFEDRRSAAKVCKHTTTKGRFLPINLC